MDSVVESVLFDDEWYAGQVGVRFGSREEAAAHWVEHAAGSPHPLFEPRWLYPRERWRRSATDPLSFYLSSPEDQATRSPHPLVDLTVTGPLSQWLVTHDPAELLGPDLPRRSVGEVVVAVQVGGLPRAVRWMRSLADADVTARMLTEDPDEVRILTSVARSLPSVSVGTATVSRVTVEVGRDVRPPRWDWLPPLVSVLSDPTVGEAQPLLLTPDGTVASPLLVGHPVADAQRLSGLDLPRTEVSVLARQHGEGPRRLAPSSVLVVDAAPTARDGGDPELWAAAGFDGVRGRPLTVREGRPALRWTLDIAAPATGFRWGDTHFARSLKDALERLGQWVALDHPESRGRATRDLEDVTLTIRGLDRVEPDAGPPGRTSLLWVISHPELVTADEVAAHDAAFAASHTWAADRSREWSLTIDPLLQCTDPALFHPGLAEPDTGAEFLYVGSSRGVLRAGVREAVDAGLPLSLHGGGWAGLVPIRAEPFVRNDELGALYAAAGVVLNDHWEDMRDQGFVSNRVFDVLATGARLLTDDVAGLRDSLGPAVADVVRVWHDSAEFRTLTTRPCQQNWPNTADRTAAAELVVVEHSFDARARTLLDAALRWRRE